MLSEKEILILEILMQNHGKYLTSKSIAEQITVAEKTARKYANLLSEQLDKAVAELISTPGHGFKFKIHDKVSFQRFFRESKMALSNKTDITYIEETKDRQYYVLRKLIFDDQMVTFENVLIELAISQSTFLNDIQLMNKKLKPYGLNLKTNKKTGLSVEGAERNKRHFIMDYFFVERVQNNLRSLGEISKLLDTISSEEILLIVLDECRNASLKLNDTVILNIVTHISLAIKRVEEGYQINFDHYLDQEKYANELSVAANIVDRLKKSAQVKLPREEVFNIALHLKNKRLKSSMSIVDEETILLKEQIQSVLRSIKQDTGINLEKDTIVLNGLIDHFSILLDRLINNSKLSNPLLKEIQSNYLSAFNLTKKHFSKMDQLIVHNVSDDEWAYIALHIIAGIERSNSDKKLSTLVICATGIGSSQMLKVRLENELGSKLTIVNVISYYEISDDVLQDVDLIISSIDLSNVVFNIPVVNVSVLLNQVDIKAIKETIGSNLTINQSIRSEKKDTEKAIRELIEKYFRPELFNVSRTISKKEDALNRMIDKSIALDNSIDREFLVGQLKLRENFSSVVFSEHIAVPHPIEGIGENSIVGVLITPKGITWDDNSDKIKLTLLMIPDKYGDSGLEDVSKALLPIIEQDKLLEELIKTKNIHEFTNKIVELLAE